MALEIERKFLVKKELWDLQSKPEGMPVIQGYLSKSAKQTVRIRILDDEGFITLKGPFHAGIRNEFEYPVPADDVYEMFSLFDPPHVEKIRYRVIHQGKRWEVDEFKGKNAGLFLAEIELTDPGETFERPEWLGEEVTGDPRYLNENLV